MIAGFLQEADHLWRHAVNTKSDEFVGIGGGQACGAELFDKFAADIEDAEGDEFVAIEAASVAGDDEFNILLAGLGEIDALEVAGGPIGFVIRIVVLAVIDERKGDFSGLVAMRDGPASGAGIGSAGDQSEYQGAGDQDVRD